MHVMQLRKMNVKCVAYKVVFCCISPIPQPTTIFVAQNRITVQTRTNIMGLRSSL